MIALVALCLLSQSVDSDGQTPRTRAPNVNEAEAQAIGARLRCPVCQGMPISESPSEMAQAMMKRVREMLAEGQSHDQIVTFFTQRYGDWVLLDPRKSGINWLLWGAPPLALILGALVVRRYAAGEPRVSAKATERGASRQHDSRAVDSRRSGVAQGPQATGMARERDEQQATNAAQRRDEQQATDATQRRDEQQATDATQRRDEQQATRATQPNDPYLAAVRREVDQ